MGKMMILETSPSTYLRLIPHSIQICMRMSSMGTHAILESTTTSMLQIGDKAGVVMMKRWKKGGLNKYTW